MQCSLLSHLLRGGVQISTMRYVSTHICRITHTCTTSTRECARTHKCTTSTCECARTHECTTSTCECVRKCQGTHTCITSTSTDRRMSVRAYTSTAVISVQAAERQRWVFALTMGLSSIVELSAYEDNLKLQEAYVQGARMGGTWYVESFVV